MDIKELLKLAIERNASDIHIVPNYYPTLRINNELYFLRDYPIVTKDEGSKMVRSILTEEQSNDLLANKELDFGYEFNQYRFRVNVYQERNNTAASLRLIPPLIKTLQELNLPESLQKLTKNHQGLVLLTGPTGEGKSTTLATLINEINKHIAKNIITIEDPIEFVYPPNQSLISQRELHQDTHSYTAALRSVLREDPDIVLVGEMRDYDTIQAVLTIAETGHLVFSTLHTKSAPETIDRIIDVFPSQQQNQIRSQLASVLISVISQRLLPTIDHTSRVPSLEILYNTSAVASIIREGKNFMLDNVIETSEDSGMILFEKYLAQLCQRGVIDKETAVNYALRPREITKFLNL